MKREQVIYWGAVCSIVCAVALLAVTIWKWKTVDPDETETA